LQRKEKRPKKKIKNQKGKKNLKKEKKTWCLLLKLARASWLNSTLHSYFHKQIVWGGTNQTHETTIEQQ
jgi:hypothetical protein